MATYFSYDLALNYSSTGTSYAYTNNTGKMMLVNINLQATNVAGPANVYGTATTSGGGGVNRTYYVYSGHISSITSVTFNGSTMIMLIPGQTVTISNGASGPIQLTGFTISN